MVIDPVVAEEFSLGRHHHNKVYFKDVESIANLPQHQLASTAKEVLYDCNLYRYRKGD